MYQLPPFVGHMFVGGATSASPLQAGAGRTVCPAAVAAASTAAASVHHRAPRAPARAFNPFIELIVVPPNEIRRGRARMAPRVPVQAGARWSFSCRGPLVVGCAPRR